MLFHEPANAQQLKFLISLCNQLGIAYDVDELAALTKWQAAERISALRGRPVPTEENLDSELRKIARARAKSAGDLEDALRPDVTPVDDRPDVPGESRRSRA
jgi:hypothetical protein